MTKLTGAGVLAIPAKIAAQLPKKGKARVILLTGEKTDATAWQHSAYEQFLRDDSPEDAVYEAIR